MGTKSSSVETRQVRHRSPFQSVLSNWAGFIVAACIALFLSPFVVRHLGNTAYGIWVLIGSLTGYLGLLDLGVRGAVTKYVSSFHAVGSHEEVRRVASSALLIFVGAGTLAVLVSVALAIFGVSALDIPSSYRATAQIILVLAGINIAVSLVSGVFGGILVALQRFDLVNAIEILSGILRAAAVVIVLEIGFGLIALAAVQLVFAIATCLFYARISLQQYPQLSLSLWDTDRQHLRKIFSFSSYAFVIAISTKLVFSTDSVVIGAFLPVSFITFFAIAGNLINYSRDLISGISTTAAPRASALDAAADKEGVRRVLLKSAQFATIVILPIAITLMLRGKTFIRLWMGAQYAEQSGHVLWILMLSSVFVAGEQAVTSTIMGIGKHKPLAGVYLAEGLCNLGLSIALVHSMGIYGVAWGTTLPSLAKSFFFWPWYVRRILRIPVWEYVSSNWLRPIAGAAPFAVISYLIERQWAVTYLGVFFLQIVAILPFAALGYWYFCFDAVRRTEYSERVLQPVLKRLRLALIGWRRDSLFLQKTSAAKPSAMIPWRLKQALRPALLSLAVLAFRSGFRNTRTLQWLNFGWGNEGWSADTAYLRAMCRWASQVRGPILECGSGLTTIMLGMVAPGRVTSLEHLSEWQRHVQQTTARHSIGTNVLAAPLTDYGEFDWYSLPPSLSNGYELVICDGPPGATRGGRYGLLPTIGHLLAPNALILMDDIERRDEQDIIQRWVREFGVSSEECRTANSAYAILKVDGKKPIPTQT